MHGPLFVESHSTVKVAGCTEKIKATGLPVIALVRLVDIRLCENEDLGAKRIPFDLGALCLEERLLTSRGCAERGETEDLDTSRLALYNVRSVQMLQIILDWRIPTRSSDRGRIVNIQHAHEDATCGRLVGIACPSYTPFSLQ